MKPEHLWSKETHKTAKSKIVLMLSDRLPDSSRSKALRTPHVLCILTSKCAFRHSDMQFLRVRTSKSAPTMRCFVHFHSGTEQTDHVSTSQRPKMFPTPHGLYMRTDRFSDISSSKSVQKHRYFVHFHLQMCFALQRRAIFSTSQVKKNVPNTSCFVHFHFQMRVSPQRRAIFARRNFHKCFSMRCFVHFHFQMCFSPQRRAIFREENSKKCSRTFSFLAFRLQNVRFVTAACNFSRREQQKVLSDLQFFNISTSEYAFRHSGVQFFEKRTAKSALGPSVF